MEGIFALDFGTSSLKAGLIGPGGNLLWSSSRVFPQVPDYSNWHSNQWLFTLEQVFSEFNRDRERLNLDHPEGVVVSGNGPTMVLLGKNYSKQRRGNWPVLLWMTSPDEAMEGEPSFYLPKLNHVSSSDPGLFQDTTRVMSGPEYISWVISGSEHTISPHGEFQPYIWTGDSVRNYGFPPELFPPFVRPGTVTGEVDGVGSAITGLREGTPVIAGGSDFFMSLLGTGVIEEGLTCDRAGTSEGINYCSASPVDNPHLRTLPHIIEGKYNVAGILSSTGRMFEWFRTFSHQRSTSYQEMMEAISRVSLDAPAPWFFPSVHHGSSWDFKGGIFAGLQPEHSSAELGRAVVHAIGFSIRSALEYLSGENCMVNEMRSCGGQAKNPLWCQMKADITGVRILVPRIKDAELSGCAVLGYSALGRFSGIAEAVEGLVSIEHVYEPDAGRSRQYQKKYIAWRESYEYIQEAAVHLPYLQDEAEHEDSGGR